MDCKKRTHNFSAKEEAILIELIKKHRAVIENKKTDTVTNKQKAAAWLQVENEFNAISEVRRDSKVLRNKYDNMKKATKKKVANEMSCVKSTGGGPLKKVKYTVVEGEILEMLGSQATGFDSQFDDDVLSDTENLSKDFNESVNWNLDPEASEKENLQEIEMQEVAITKDEQQGTSTQNWAEVTPLSLKMPISKVLQVKNRNDCRPTKQKQQLNNKLGEWAKSKQNLANLQQEYFIKEKELLLKNINEKHLKELEFMENEENRKKEEHKIKMEILKKQLVKPN